MKFNLKSFITGFVTALACTACVFTVFGAGAIKSAVFNSNKVVFDGKELDLSNSPMISIIKEGETNAGNYMPVRGVLEAMGYNVDWDSEAKAVIVNTKFEAGSTSLTEDNDSDSYRAGMANPWDACTEDEAFKKLGAKFTITPLTGYTLLETAVLAEPYAEAMSDAARFVYTNANEEMYRVHINVNGAGNLLNQGELVKTNGIDAYYNKDESSVSYAQEDYLIVIDMAEKSKDELLKTVGSVVIAK